MKKYCSNALMEEVKTHLESLWFIRYSTEINFLKNLKIKEPMYIEHGNIKIDIKPSQYKAYINDLLISESTLDNLNQTLIKVYSKPFYYLRLDTEILGELERLTNPAPIGCVYKAVLEMPGVWVENEVLNKIIVHKNMPTQDELTNFALESNYEYHD